MSSINGSAATSQVQQVHRHRVQDVHKLPTFCALGSYKCEDYDYEYRIYQYFLEALGLDTPQQQIQ